MAYAHIASPISGRIGKSTVTQGALVTADQAAALATVTQLDPIYVDVNQSSSEWLQFQREIGTGFVRSGQGARATDVLEDGSAYGHEGKLQFADVTVEQSTGNFLLRVLVPNPDQLLMPGMYVRAVISEGYVPHGLLVPQQGITHDPQGQRNGAGGCRQRHGRAARVKTTRSIGNQWLVDAASPRAIASSSRGCRRCSPACRSMPSSRR